MPDIKPVSTEIPESSPGVFNRWEAAEREMMAEIEADPTPEPVPEPTPAPVVPPVVPPVADGDGDTWEKRYKDLQSRTTGVFQAKADLERLVAQMQLKEAERPSEVVPPPVVVPDVIELPGEGDLPEVAAMVRAAIAPILNAVKPLAEARKADDLDAIEKTRRQGIYDQIFDAHPDTRDTVASNDFKLWLEENPRYKPLVEKTVEYDPLSTITMLDLYKKSSVKPVVVIPPVVPPPPTDVVIPSVPGVPFQPGQVEDDFSDLGDLATLPRRIVQMPQAEQDRILARIDAGVKAGLIRG